MARAKDYEVMVVNPGKPRRRRRARRAPAAAAAPRRRRRGRRQRNPGSFGAVRRSSGRRSNPSFMGLNLGITSTITDGALRLLGKIAGAWAVRMFNFGNEETQQISGGVSPTTGLRWSFWNHVVCIGAGIIAGGILGKVRPGAGQKVFEGAFDLSVQKAFWSEVVHRTTAGPKYLGAADEGDVKETAGGTFIRENGRWVAMMGLKERSALDGLVEASAMGRTMGRRPMGHLLPADARGSLQDRIGRYSRSASSSPYHSAYSRG